MNNLKIQGKIAELAGGENFNVSLNNLADILGFLYQLNPEIKQFLTKTEVACFYRQDDDLIQITPHVVIPAGETVYLTPVVEGEFTAAAFVWAGAYAGAVAVAANLVISMALSYLLAPSIESPDFDEAEVNNSVYFQGGVNTQQQGAPVSLVYGHCRVANPRPVATALDTEEGKAL